LTAVDVLRTIDQNPRITPLEISQKLKTNAQQVRNILLVLAELKLVETPVRGVYLVTELGKRVLGQ
jgi:predicted transcriptional regulator